MQAFVLEGLDGARGGAVAGHAERAQLVGGVLRAAAVAPANGQRPPQGDPLLRLVIHAEVSQVVHYVSLAMFQ